MISRTIGVIAGGSIGFLTSPENNTVDVPVNILLGVAIGYRVIEIALQIYKSIEGKRIVHSTWSKKEATWDREFTLETHRARLLLYRAASKSIQDIYDEKRIKVRQEAKDFQKMTEMFMQKPNVEKSSASRVIDFLRTCSEIEYQMAEYTNNNLKEQFSSYVQNKDVSKDLSKDDIDLFLRGMRGLATFLRKNKKIDEELFDDILKVRKRRIKLFFHDDYTGFDIDLKKNMKDRQIDVISLAPKVLNTLIEKLGNN